MTLCRAIILNSDESSELLHLRDAFHAAQTPSHDGYEELDALRQMLKAQRMIAEGHDLDPVKCSFGFLSDNDATWSVQVTYPLTTDEEERVRGLG